MANMKKSLFAELRRKEIESLVKEQGALTVDDLCTKFSVSPATIRNDLNDLEKQGVLQRTHGGAIPHNKPGMELTSHEKRIKNVTEKSLIAQKALEYIHSGDVIILDTGTTTYEIAKLLGNFSNLTVITNDLQIASVLDKVDHISVFLLGGIIRPQFHCTYGVSVLNALDDFFVDIAFMATNGISTRRGLSTPSVEIAYIKKKMMSVAARSIVVADSTKVANESFSVFASISEVDTFITDSQVSTSFLNELSACGVNVVLAD